MTFVMHFCGTIHVNLFPHGVPLKQLELFNVLSSVPSVLHLNIGMRFACTNRIPLRLFVVTATSGRLHAHENTGFER